MYRAHNSDGAFLGSFIATSAKAAARQLRRDWHVASGDVVTVSAVSGNDSVTVRTRQHEPDPSEQYEEQPQQQPDEEQS